MPDPSGAGAARPEPASTGASPAPSISHAEPDGRLHSPHFERNNAPIRARLAELLRGVDGPILDIGCGTGQHAARLAAEYPHRTVLPTDIFPEHRASAAAWARHLGLGNVAPPRPLDAAADWAESVADAGPFALVLAVNVIHIAPWAVAEGLVAGAARVLAPGGVLALYGPFIEPGQPLGEGNRSFDASLRSRNPAWGLRSTEAVAALAAAAGLAGLEIVPMPADNRVLSVRRPA